MATSQKTAETLSPSDRATARDVVARLRSGGGLVATGKGGQIAVPQSMARDVIILLEAYAEGRTPMVAAADEEVGTQEAAVILNLSRPTVVKLLDEGRIPFRKPGKHRRVQMSDLMAFKARVAGQRTAALERLSSLAQAALENAREQGGLTDEMI